ncbi:hypothetical protein HK104_004193, partial [Borealophlyctis nickersoniae]
TQQTDEECGSIEGSESSHEESAVSDAGSECGGLDDDASRAPSPNPTLYTDLATHLDLSRPEQMAFLANTTAANGYHYTIHALNDALDRNGQTTHPLIGAVSSLLHIPESRLEKHLEKIPPPLFPPLSEDKNLEPMETAIRSVWSTHHHHGLDALVGLYEAAGSPYLFELWLFEFDQIIGAHASGGL